MLELTTVVDIIIIIIIIGQARAAARRLCWGGEGGGCIPPDCGQSSGSLHPVGTGSHVRSPSMVGYWTS